MTRIRSYGEGCAAAHALDLVGERWALLVVRELLLGPKRFTDLRAGLCHASPNVLAQRLRELERDGIVRRRKLGPPFGTSVYELTDWGKELEPVITSLGRWGVRSPTLPQNAAVSGDSVVLALRTLFDADTAGDLTASYDLQLGEDRFSINVADGRLEVERGEAAKPDAVIETDASTFAALFTKRQTLSQATKKGQLKLTGDADVVGRLLNAFPVPDPLNSA